MNRKSKKYVLFIAVLFILLPVLFAGNSFIEAQKLPEIDRQDFREEMRTLWVDHSRLTRQFMISTISDLPQQSDAAEHLIQNQNEIGASIALFYGDEAGEELGKLLAEHTVISATMYQAARNADARAFEESVTRWYDNADEIAELLSNLNPENWPLRETRPVMRTYLDLTLEQAVAYWNGYSDIGSGAYEKVQDHALEIADMLSKGIINKFGQRFK
jgi:hypothetical protein